MSQVIYRFNATLIKILIIFFAKIERLILNSYGGYVMYELNNMGYSPLIKANLATACCFRYQQ